MVEYHFIRNAIPALGKRDQNLTHAGASRHRYRIYRRSWNEAVVAGAFPICHHGCALRDWLVVTGPEAVQVWHDARVDGNGLHPYERADGHRMTFMDWYLDWLNDALRTFRVKFAIRLP